MLPIITYIHHNYNNNNELFKLQLYIAQDLIKNGMKIHHYVQVLVEQYSEYKLIYMVIYIKLYYL